MYIQDLTVKNLIVQNDITKPTNKYEIITNNRILGNGHLWAIDITSFVEPGPAIELVDKTIPRGQNTYFPLGDISIITPDLYPNFPIMVFNYAPEEYEFVIVNKAPCIKITSSDSPPNVIRVRYYRYVGPLINVNYSASKYIDVVNSSSLGMTAISLKPTYFAPPVPTQVGKFLKSIEDGEVEWADIPTPEVPDVTLTSPNSTISINGTQIDVSDNLHISSLHLQNYSLPTAKGNVGESLTILAGDSLTTYLGWAPSGQSYSAGSNISISNNTISLADNINISGITIGAGLDAYSMPTSKGALGSTLIIGSDGAAWGAPIQMPPGVTTLQGRSGEISISGVVGGIMTIGIEANAKISNSLCVGGPSPLISQTSALYSPSAEFGDISIGSANNFYKLPTESNQVGSLLLIGNNNQCVWDNNPFGPSANISTTWSNGKYISNLSDNVTISNSLEVKTLKLGSTNVDKYSFPDAKGAIGQYLELASSGLIWANPFNANSVTVGGRLDISRPNNTVLLNVKSDLMLDTLRVGTFQIPTSVGNVGDVLGVDSNGAPQWKQMTTTGHTLKGTANKITVSDPVNGEITINLANRLIIDGAESDAPDDTKIYSTDATFGALSIGTKAGNYKFPTTKPTGDGMTLIGDSNGTITWGVISGGGSLEITGTTDQIKISPEGTAGGVKIGLGDKIIHTQTTNMLTNKDFNTGAASFTSVTIGTTINNYNLPSELLSSGPHLFDCSESANTWKPLISSPAIKLNYDSEFQSYCFNLHTDISTEKISANTIAVGTSPELYHLPTAAGAVGQVMGMSKTGLSWLDVFGTNNTSYIPNYFTGRGDPFDNQTLYQLNLTLKSAADASNALLNISLNGLPAGVSLTQSNMALICISEDGSQGIVAAANPHLSEDYTILAPTLIADLSSIYNPTAKTYKLICTPFTFDSYDTIIGGYKFYRSGGSSIYGNNNYIADSMNIVAGSHNVITKPSSCSFGSYNVINSDRTTVSGFNNSAKGEHSEIVGCDNSAFGENSIIIGAKNTIQRQNTMAPIIINLRDIGDLREFSVFEQLLIESNPNAISTIIVDNPNIFAHKTINLLGETAIGQISLKINDPLKDDYNYLLSSCSSVKICYNGAIKSLSDLIRDETLALGNIAHKLKVKVGTDLNDVLPSSYVVTSYGFDIINPEMLTMDPQNFKLEGYFIRQDLVRPNSAIIGNSNEVRSRNTNVMGAGNLSRDGTDINVLGGSNALSLSARNVNVFGSNNVISGIDNKLTPNINVFGANNSIIGQEHGNINIIGGESCATTTCAEISLINCKGLEVISKYNCAVFNGDANTTVINSTVSVPGLHNRGGLYTNISTVHYGATYDVYPPIDCEKLILQQDDLSNPTSAPININLPIFADIGRDITFYFNSYIPIPKPGLMSCYVKFVLSGLDDLSPPEIANYKIMYRPTVQTQPGKIYNTSDTVGIVEPNLTPVKATKISQYLWLLESETRFEDISQVGGIVSA